MYYKACAKHFPVLLCTTKLAQSTFQNYFVLHTLHKVRPSTTLYYKACKKHFPVLLCTTKLALCKHKARSRTTLYYTPCTKYVPVLLCTTKLAQSTSQYYFVIQSLHKALPSTSSTRTRRGGSCLKEIYIYKTFLIYRTCMRRAPAKPVRACTLRNWCFVSHVTFEAPLHTSHLTVFTLRTTHFTLHSSHCTLRSQHFTSHCTLKTPHFTLHIPHFTVHTSHCTLRTPNFTLHSPHFTLHSPHFTLLTASFTLQTSHFTLHTALFTPNTSHCTLHTPHFISAELFSPYPSSALLISSLLICHLSFHESLPSTTTKELA